MLPPLRCLGPAIRLARGWRPWLPLSGAVFRRRYSRARRLPAFAEEPLTELGQQWSSLQNERANEREERAKSQKQASKRRRNQKAEEDAESAKSWEQGSMQRMNEQKSAGRGNRRPRTSGKPAYVDSLGLNGELTLDIGERKTSAGREGERAGVARQVQAKRHKSNQQTATRIQESVESPPERRSPTQKRNDRDKRAKRQTRLQREEMQNQKVGQLRPPATEPVSRTTRTEKAAVRKADQSFMTEKDEPERRWPNQLEKGEALEEVAQAVAEAKGENMEFVRQVKDHSARSVTLSAFQRQIEQDRNDEDETLLRINRNAWQILQSVAGKKPRFLKTEDPVQDGERSTTRRNPRKAVKLTAKKATPDFSTRQAVRHLLGLPNGSVPASKLPVGPPIFLCVDLEAHEFQQKKILELGIAMLDLNRMGPYPGYDPSNLLAEIVYKHYIISEHKHIMNKKHAISCKDRFLFGDSETKLGGEVAKLYRNFPEIRRFPATATSRPVVLVGHHLKGDIQYLASLGVDIYAWPGLIGAIDTQKLAVADHVPLKLEKTLAAFGVPVRFPHNAGNDAAFTMHAMLLFALCKDEWKAAGEMEKARSFIFGRQHVGKTWPIPKPAEKKQSEKAQEKLSKQKMRRGKPWSTEIVVYDPAVVNRLGGQQTEDAIKAPC